MDFLDYVIQFAGSVIQTVPVMILLFLPFEKHELRISGAKLHLIQAVSMLIYGLIFAYYVGIVFDMNVTNEEVQQKADLLMVIALCATAIFFIINVHIKSLKKLFVFMLAVYYGAMVFTLSSLGIHLFILPGVDSRAPYTPDNLWSLFLATVIVLPVMWRIMAVKLNDLFKLIGRHQLGRSCVYMAIELVLYCIFIYLIPSFEDFSAVVIMICYAAANILMLYFFFKEISLTQGQLFMEEKLRAFNSEYNSIKNNISEMARFRHDMRHHFGIISTLNAEGEKEALEEYLQRYVDAYEQFEKIQICEYPLVNTILKYYIERCHQLEIQPKIVSNLKEDMGFDPVDITVLLGNCMENAINACRQLPEADRYICVKIMKMNGSLLIYIENTMNFDETGNPKKADTVRSLSMGKWAGYGTESIYKVAKKYDGSAEFKREKNHFIAQIILNL